MAGTSFKVEYDTNGNIIEVVDVDGKTIPWGQSSEISKEPLKYVSAVTFTMVYVANSCYVYQNGRKVKVC
jgi:hypothetical protein